MSTIRSRLVTIALEWEREFGNAPQITSTVSEYDAAMLVGMSEFEYRDAMRGSTAVQRGFDFRHNGLRYQIKATRPSGKPGSKVTKVPRATNYEWDVLIWMSYNSKYELLEAWAWDVQPYRSAFCSIKRLSPAHMRQGKALHQPFNRQQ